MGDDVQNLKAGVMEIGDVFVLNKADRPGAERFEQQLRAILGLVPERDGWRPPVVRTIATENAGIRELAAAIEVFRNHHELRTDQTSRDIRLWKERLLQLLSQRLLERAMGGADSARRLEDAAKQVAARECDPYTAVERLLEKPRRNGAA